VWSSQSAMRSDSRGAPVAVPLAQMDVQYYVRSSVKVVILQESGLLCDSLGALLESGQLSPSHCRKHAFLFGIFNRNHVSHCHETSRSWELIRVDRIERPPLRSVWTEASATIHGGGHRIQWGTRAAAEGGAIL